jgi:hypothetical protein
MKITRVIFLVVFLLGLPGLGSALEDTSPKPTVIPALESVEPATRDNGANNGPTSPSRVLPGEPPTHKNYWLPALEIPVFIALWNRFDRVAFGGHDYESTWASGWDHVVHGPWVVDQDAFAINQFGHPYQGTVYYGIARSSGLNFWESYLYTNAGSFIWETYGETTRPSINDQIASGTAGSLFGEPLFRMASLVLEGGDEKPGFWRELGAGLILPPAEINRVVFGHDYGPLIEHRHPAYFMQVRAGVGQNTLVRAPGSSSEIARDMAAADFSMGYGLPGKSGYHYRRPFDYFHFEIEGMAEKRSTFENVMTRGLLFGAPYESGEALRGVWGLYGTYDYLSPQVYRVSTTAAQFGTTLQRWFGRKVALQATGLTGVGYGSAGTIVPTNDEGDFHYGLAPQGLLAARLIFGERVMIDTTARGYFITTIGASRAPGTEHIVRIDSSFLVRLYGPHCVGAHYVVTSREAHYTSSLPDRSQRVETLLFAYSYVSDFHFGAVEWNRL